MNIIDETKERSQYVEEIAAYIRVSTQEQKLHGISLEAQVEKLQEYANKHNMKIVEWYKDEGVSGRKLIKNRPELQRMLHDAETGKFKRIIFIKLDRFFRSVAEYHKCMEILDKHKVIWTATEEQFDLATPSGVAFVNMKLTMAQFEADQVGERIRMVNEHKIKTGQPLFGTQSLPFCFTVKHPENGERNKYIEKRNSEVMEDLIAHIMVNRSVRAALVYINNKYNLKLFYGGVMKALTNEMIYGSYRGNPNYCPAYISKEMFDKLQEIIKRNPRTSNNEYTYIFTGLIRCPVCGNRLTGSKHHSDRPDGGKYISHTYRCNKYRTSHICTFKHVIFEKTFEKMLLANLETIVENKHNEHIERLHAANDRVSKYDLDELNNELDRLNYSWRKGRIRTEEEYEEAYNELMAQIDKANEERAEIEQEPELEQVLAMLTGDWKERYKALENDGKRAFWRSFINEIHVVWDKKNKQIVDIDFF